MLLARLDPGSRSLVYTGAGHPPGYILDHTGAVRATLDSTSLPLGIIDDGEFPPEPPVTLQPGDLVFLYTDGVVETIGPDGSFFGIERALDVIRSTRGESACEIVRASSEASRQFARQEKRHDDFTAVVIKVLNRPPDRYRRPVRQIGRSPFSRQQDATRSGLRQLCSLADADPGPWKS